MLQINFETQYVVMYEGNIRTFLWLNKILTLGFPRRSSDWSMTSSCISDAECIISETIATCLCDSERPLQKCHRKNDTNYLRNYIGRLIWNMLLGYLLCPYLSFFVFIFITSTVRQQKCEKFNSTSFFVFLWSNT